MQILTDVTELVGGASIIQGALTVSNQGTSVDMNNANIATGAIVEYGAPAAAVTGCTVQIEEWDGTSNAGSTWTAIPNMVAASVTTGPKRQTLLGLRTHRYVRANAITFATNTNANVPLCVELLGMPKSSGGSTATGFSRSPSV